MIKLILRIIINTVAIWVAAILVPGISLTSDVLSWLIVAVIFGIINVLIKPLVKLLTLPLSIMTLGLFTLVINALMLMLTAFLTDILMIEGPLLGFVPALLGSIIISIVSTILNWFVKD